MNKLKPLHYWFCHVCWNAYHECECNELKQETNLKVIEILWQK